MLNKVMLIGNLGADPESRHTQDGTCVCNLRLATTEKFKNQAGEQQEKTEWHRVVLWGKLAEIANQYLTKGAKVFIEGKIETRKWQDRDGNDKYTTEIRGFVMKMLGGGSGRNESSSQDQGGFPAQGGNQSGQSSDPFTSSPDERDLPEEDRIPF